MDCLHVQNQEYRLAREKIGKDYREMKHILGYFQTDPDSIVQSRMEQMMDSVHQAVNAHGVYSVFPVSCDGESVDLGFCKVHSEHLKRNLRGCHHIILCAVTIGMQVDRQIQIATKKSATDGYLAQAAGAALVESFMNCLNDDLKQEYEKQGYYLRPRFSCGYGDFDLKHQRDIFRALPRTAAIGLTLMDTDIMAPSKSITAVIGICDNKDGEDYLPSCDKCEICTKKVNV